MKEYKLKINGSNYDVAVEEVDETTATVEVNGTPYTVEFEKPITKVKSIKVVKPAANQSPATITSVKTTVSSPVVNAGETVISSPLPGVILDVKVKAGDTVKKGQTLMILEAMKMENSIEATTDGTIKEIKVNKGDSVLEGAQLIVIG